MGVLDTFVSEDDLKVHESTYGKAALANVLTVKDKFNYAVCLVQSHNAVDIHKGIRILKEIDNQKDLDYLYYLALGYGHLSDFEMSLCFIDEILSKDSFHRQAHVLRSEIRDRVTIRAKMQRTEDIKQGAIVAGGFLAVLGGIGAVAYALSGSKKKNDNEPK